MPLPIIAAVISAVAGLTTTELGIHAQEDAAAKQQKAQQNLMNEQAAQQKALQTKQTEAAVSSNMPNTQAALGGTATPEYMASIGAGGNANLMNQVANQFLGLNPQAAQASSSNTNGAASGAGSSNMPPEIVKALISSLSSGGSGGAGLSGGNA